MNTLPNLSNLCLINESLFPYLIKNDNAKQPNCRNHKEPISLENKEDNNYHINCAIDGYFMYKEVPYDEVAVVALKYGTDITVQDTYEEEDLTLTFRSFGSKGLAWHEKDARFSAEHKEWTEETFKQLCMRGEGLGSIGYAGYKEELFKKTDWYYLDTKSKNGQMFISIVDTKSRRNNLHLADMGVFEGTKFLYIALVCATNKFGKTMMNAAETICARFKLDGILLSALSNSAGAYMNWGYKFVSRLNGKYIDVSRFMVPRADQRGEEKLFLDSNIDHDFDKPIAREKRKAEEEPEGITPWSRLWLEVQGARSQPFSQRSQSLSLSAPESGER